MPLRPSKLCGLVIAVKANYLEVQVNLEEKTFFEIEKNLSDIQNQRFLCKRRAKLGGIYSFVAVGDKVLIDSIDWKNFRAVVSYVEPRKTFLSRPSIANVTDIFVVLSCDQPSFNSDQATRFLLSAEKSGINVYLILTKCDLIDSKILNKELSRLRNWSYEVLPISVPNNYGLDLLKKRLLSTKLSVFYGPSGVGKSSLLNTLCPNVCVKVGPLSKKLKRGVNTTRHVELFSLGPTSFVADTPGFNRPELMMEANELSTLFPEFRKSLSLSTCQFRNCLHHNEPGCCINKSCERYVLYRQYLEEIIRSRH